jgi:hypothetical protein
VPGLLAAEKDTNSGEGLERAEVLSLAGTEKRAARHTEASQDLT